MKKGIGIALLMLLLALSVNAQEDGLTDARFAALARGVNLSHWVWLPQRPNDPNFFDSFITAQDMTLLREVGFTHVRLPFNPAYLIDEDDPDLLRDFFLNRLDTAVDLALEADLAIIIDMHPLADFLEALAMDDAHVEQVEQVWRNLAAHFSERDPNQVFLEVMNEPAFNLYWSESEQAQAAARWYEVQGRLLAAMREGAPDHTLIATSYTWDGLDELIEMQPYDDPNIVYNFHFYDPFPFTHQGAEWVGAPFSVMREIPYPSSPEAVAELAAASASDVREAIEWYGNENWNEERLDARVRLVADWAAEYGVRVTANEFGAYRVVAPAEDRLRWTQDIVTVFERYNIGWSMWDYAGGFALANGEEGARTLDAALVEALGLGG